MCVGKDLDSSILYEFLQRDACVTKRIQSTDHSLCFVIQLLDLRLNCRRGMGGFNILRDNFTSLSSGRTMQRVGTSVELMCKLEGDRGDEPGRGPLPF